MDRLEVRAVRLMRHTIETDPHAIRRYSHVRPARGWKVKRCDAACRGAEHLCTRELGHRGPHVAHGSWGRVKAVWEGDVALRAPPEALQRVVEAARQGGLPSRRSGGALESLGRWVTDRVSSVEDAAMLILFLAFLGFAVDWFLRMLG